MSRMTNPAIIGMRKNECPDMGDFGRSSTVVDRPKLVTDSRQNW